MQARGTVRYFILLAAGLAMAGCATVTRGTTDQITVTSQPSEAHVATTLSQACTTPCTFPVARKDEFVVTVSKDGYKPQEIPVKTQLAGAGAAGFAGNILLGGVVGMGVDAATGSTLEHVPNPINVVLQPTGASAGVTHAARHRVKALPADPAPEATPAPPST
jgi:hypothetical protein